MRWRKASDSKAAKGSPYSRLGPVPCASHLLMKADLAVSHPRKHLSRLARLSTLCLLASCATVGSVSALADSQERFHAEVRAALGGLLDGSRPLPEALRSILLATETAAREARTTAQEAQEKAGETGWRVWEAILGVGALGLQGWGVAKGVMWARDRRRVKLGPAYVPKKP